VGSVAAILAAYKMGRTQIEADRTLEASRRAYEDKRRLVAIDAMLANLESSIRPLRDGLAKLQIPTKSLCLPTQIADACKAIRAIDIYGCPSPDVIPLLALIPSQCDGLLAAMADYDKSFDELAGDTAKELRGLRNSLELSRMGIDLARGACRKSIATINGSTSA
jgi:hypothetical protein